MKAMADNSVIVGVVGSVIGIVLGYLLYKRRSDAEVDKIKAEATYAPTLTNTTNIVAIN